MPTIPMPQKPFDLGRAITAAVRELLTEKHLYQSVEVPGVREFLEKGKAEMDGKVGALTTIGESGVNFVPDMKDDPVYVDLSRRVRALTAEKNKLWKLSDKEDLDFYAESDESYSFFSLPRLELFCPSSRCGNEPFNPGTNESWGKLHGVSRTLVDGFSDTQQLFTFHYQCQRCLGAPVTFLIRRKGLKLTLCGRDPIEQIIVPDYVPKASHRYYSNAVLAHQSGDTLSGLFLLRTLIEQYWIALGVSVKSEGRATGEESGVAYNAMLPVLFKNHFPSFTEYYSKLSVAIHGALQDAALFEEAREAIVRHFEGIKVLKVELKKAESA